MRRRIVVAFAIAPTLLVGCSGDTEPGAARDGVAANPAAATGLRLSEIRFLPADDAPLFVEIENTGQAPVGLGGAFLQMDGGATIALPGGVTVAPSALLVLRFDDGQGFDAGGVHLPAADFTGGEAGQIELRLPTGVADAVAWGRPELASVSLCRGGRCTAPKAGSVVARIPNAPAPLDATAWALLDPELATPGLANPLPPVSELAALPGFIFTGAPRFSWYSAPGAARYRLEVGRGATFDDLLHEAEVEATPGVQLAQLTVDGRELPPGEYVWRVRALAASGESAEPSAAMPFRVDPSRAVVAPVDTRTPPAGEGRPVRPQPQTPEGILKVLDVPIIQHAKDTRMLTLEAANEDVWDTPSSDGYPYCARAGVMMVNAYYQNKRPPDQRRILSQDRIGYEVFSNLDGSPPGAEYDLPVVGIDDSDTHEHSLPLALGTNGDYVVNTDYAYGRHADACFDYVTSQALAQCASRCADVQSPDCFACRLAREREIPCPDEIEHRWGVLAIEDIQREINAERPIIATRSGHLFLIVGYRLEEGRFYFFYQDAGGRQEIQADAGGLMEVIMSYWIGLAAVDVGSDEASIADDSDNDGVVDFDELQRFGTTATDRDSDGDDVPDKAEIRASVWDPQHGYHRGVATLAPTAPTSVVEERAASADLSGRDFDRDGVAMELDRDSDGGGCRDGVEDASFDGVHDARETYNFDPDDDDCAVALGGRITMRYGFVPARAPPCKGTVDIRLRFVLEPDWGPIPEESRMAVATTYIAREAAYEIGTDGCEDIVGGGSDFFDSANVACNAPGGRKSGVVTFGPESTGQLSFFPLQPQLNLVMPTEALLDLAGACVSADGSASELPVNYVGSEFLDIGSGANCKTSDRYDYGQGPDLLDFCVEPTVCNTAEADPRALGECFTSPERYAVIPFRGALSKLGDIEEGRELEGNTFPIEIYGAEVRFEVCRGCSDEFLP